LNKPPSSSLFSLDCLERYFTFYFFFGLNFFFFGLNIYIYKQPFSNVKITKTYTIFVTTHHVASCNKLWVVVWTHYFFSTTRHVMSYDKSSLSLYDAAFFASYFFFFGHIRDPLPFLKVQTIGECKKYKIRCPRYHNTTSPIQAQETTSVGLTNNH